VVDPFADKVQSPGPCSGTSTVSKPGPSVPESSPLIAFAFDVGAARRTVVEVTLEYSSTTDQVVAVVVGVVVAVVFEVVITGVDGVLGGDVVVTDVGARVVTGDVEEAGGDEAAGTCAGDDAVRVNTSTSNSSGLDHIKRWALFIEKGERVMVFEG
jgi:hypothetical protein